MTGGRRDALTEAQYLAWAAGIDVAAHQGHRISARMNPCGPHVEAFCEDCREWLAGSAPASAPGQMVTRTLISEFCTWHPAAGDILCQPCPDCGHSDLAHIGVAHCPVCELVYQATPAFRQREMRIHGTSWPRC